MGACCGHDAVSPDFAFFEQSPDDLAEFAANVIITDGGALGIELDLLDGITARVAKVESGGAVDAWNSAAKRELRICPGDFIVAVNGVRGSLQRALQRLPRDSNIELSLLRPFSFKVTLDKDSSDTLGVDLGFADGARCLLVKGIRSGGLISRWNVAEPASRVQRSDRIVSVNGVVGDHAELMGLIQAGGQLDLVISRSGAASTMRKEPMGTADSASIQSSEGAAECAADREPVQAQAMVAVVEEQLLREEGQDLLKAAAEPSKAAADVAEQSEDNEIKTFDPSIHDAAVAPEAAASSSGGEAKLDVPSTALLTLEVVVPPGVQPGQQLQIQHPTTEPQSW